MSATDRRHWLGTLGLAAAAVLAPHRAAAQPAVMLPLTASTTEGPYYLADPEVRDDITEGLPGVPLELRLAVVDSRGQALAGSSVDVWHCDATGLYSGFAGQGDGRRSSAAGNTHLRGRQPVGADGVAAFRTIYPGWYPGRATHIHCKVWRGGKELLTTQFFLPDALSEFLYTQLPTYRRAQLRDVLNSNDGIALEAGDTVIGAVRELPDRYVASLSLVVDAAGGAASGGRRRGGPPGGRPPGLPPDGGGGPRGSRPADGAARIDALVPAAGRQRW